MKRKRLTATKKLIACFSLFPPTKCPKLVLQNQTFVITNLNIMDLGYAGQNLAAFKCEVSETLRRLEGFAFKVEKNS
jgi:hypothetical protein